MDGVKDIGDGITTVYQRERAAMFRPLYYNPHLLLSPTWTPATRCHSIITRPSITRPVNEIWNQIPVNDFLINQTVWNKSRLKLDMERLKIEKKTKKKRAEGNETLTASCASDLNLTLATLTEISF